MEPPLEDMTRRRVTVCIRGEWEGPKGLVAHARLVQVAEKCLGASLYLWVPDAFQLGSMGSDPCLGGISGAPL